MSVERRSLIQILGAGLAGTQVQGQHAHGNSGPAKTQAQYTPRALSPAQYRTIDRLAEVILPADETSPGAHDAAVARYIDIVLLYGRKDIIEFWQSGIESVEVAAKEMHRKAFEDLTTEQQAGLVRIMAANEAGPVTNLDRFFVALKELTIEAFYLSAAGKKSLGYKGDTAISNFTGCIHPEHQT